MYPIPKGEPMDRTTAADVLRDAAETSAVPKHRVLAAIETLERLPELMGTAAVAEALGTTTPNLRKWSGVPAPLYDLPAGRFYDADAIRAYAEQRRREGQAA